MTDDEFRAAVTATHNLLEGEKEARGRSLLGQLMRERFPDLVHSGDLDFIGRDMIQAANGGRNSVGVGGNISDHANVLLCMVAGYACAVLRTGGLWCDKITKDRASRKVAEWSGLGHSQIESWTPVFGRVRAAGREAQSYADLIAQYTRGRDGSETEEVLKQMINRAKDATK